MDLNTMLREQAVTGLQTRLDAAVTNGDTEAARKITKEMTDLAIATAPKGNTYGDAEIKTELNKLDWFGVDPKKSGRALALGRDMDPKKFPDAMAFTAALVKAVEEENKPLAPKTEDETDEEREDREAEEKEAAEAAKAAGKKKLTDGPGERDGGARPSRRTSSGPWTKLSDAPAEVQVAIKRSTEKFISSNAPKEQRDLYQKKALESHWNTAQLKKGK
jgi:hypothetical protein